MPIPVGDKVMIMVGVVSAAAIGAMVGTMGISDGYGWWAAPYSYIT